MGSGHSKCRTCTKLLITLTYLHISDALSLDLDITIIVISRLASFHVPIGLYLHMDACIIAFGLNSLSC